VEESIDETKGKDNAKPTRLVARGRPAHPVAGAHKIALIAALADLLIEAHLQDHKKPIARRTFAMNPKLPLNI